MMMKIAYIVFFTGTAYAVLTDNQRYKCLNEHNMLRDLHENTDDLQWDSDLETAAQNYADQLKSNNDGLNPGHDPENKDNNWGENLFWMHNSNREGVCADAIYKWYAEETNYNFVSGTGTGTIGHFTQLVWRSSEKVGVGIAISGSQTWIVAKYKPAGNVMGLYTSNVGSRKPGAVTPTRHELDYSICTNIKSKMICDWYTSSAEYGCNYPVVKNVCYKLCTGC